MSISALKSFDPDLGLILFKKDESYRSDVAFSNSNRIKEWIQKASLVH